MNIRLSRYALFQFNYSNMKSVLTILLFLFCSIAAAQWSILSDSIQITANKTEQNIRQSIKPVQIINNEEIQRNPGLGFSQILYELGGIQINGAFSAPGKDKSIYVRGVDSEFLLILIDGMPINDPSAIGANIDLRHFSTQQVERIEILRGSQSSLYGSDAISGVINIITKKPVQSKKTINAEIQGGSFNTLKSSIGLSTYKKKLSFQVLGNTYHTRGFSEAASKLPSDTYENDGLQQYNIMAKGRIVIQKAITIAPLIRYSSISSDYDYGPFVDGQETYKGQFLNVGLNTNLKMNSYDLHLRINQNNSNRLFETAFGPYHYIGNNQNADFFIKFNPIQNISAMIGTYVSSVSVNDEGFTGDNSYNTISGYGHAAYSKNLLRLETTLRYNRHSTFGGNLNYSFTPSLNWELNKIYISANSGFKAPSLSQLFGPFGANPDLLPQKSRNFEVGFRKSILKENIQLGVTYFNTQLDDVIIYAVNGYENIAAQKFSGFESSLNFKVSQKLNLKILHTYLFKAEAIDPSFPNLGADLYRRSKYLLITNLNWQVNNKLNFGLNTIYTGERTDIFFNETTFESEEVLLDPFFIINTSANYNFSTKFSAFLNIKNITNQSYYEFYGYNTPGINFNAGLRTQL